MDSFMFPATAAIMLATQTWLDDTGIADALSTQRGLPSVTGSKRNPPGAPSTR